MTRSRCVSSNNNWVFLYELTVLLSVNVLFLYSCCAPADSGVSEGLVLTSDSESEIFCDSVDSVEQLSNVKVRLSHILQWVDEECVVLEIHKANEHHCE